MSAVAASAEKFQNVQRSKTSTQDRTRIRNKLNDSLKTKLSLGTFVFSHVHPTHLRTAGALAGHRPSPALVVSWRKSEAEPPPEKHRSSKLQGDVRDLGEVI